MFFVVNISRPPQEISIEDLGVKLGPNKAMDLEKICSRKDIESSKDLKKLVKHRKIQLRQTIKSRSSSEDQPPSRPKSLDDNDIQKITKAVVAEIKASQPSAQPAIPTDLVNVLNELKQSISLSNQQSQDHEPQEKNQSKETSDDIDLDVLSEIHAKSVSRQSKSSIGKVKYQENETKDNMSSRADELRDLLG